MEIDSPQATATHATTTLKWHIVLTLSAVPLIMVLGNSMLIPVLPQIEKILKLSAFQVSLLITVFSFSAALMIPIAGILADRVGRKKVIFFSLLLYGSAGLLAGFASIWHGGSYALLLVARTIQGIGAAGTAPITMVLASDLNKGENKAKVLGIVEASNAMGKVLSPILGSLLALITWYTLFFVFPFLCLPTAIALWKWVTEPTKNQQPEPLSQYKAHFVKIWKEQGRWLSTAFVMGAVTMFTLFGLLFYLSNFLEQTLDMQGVKKGFVLAIPLLGLCLTAYWIGAHIKKHTQRMKHWLLIGLSVLALAIAAIPWIKNTYVLIAVSSFIGVGNGFILPCLNTLITSAIGLQERGVITSLYGSVRFFGVALGPPIFGALAKQPVLLFVGTASLLVLVFVLSFFFIEHPQIPYGKDTNSRLLLRKRKTDPV
jgi:MFS transporter, ACDE family, multidrug resistance protein